MDVLDSARVEHVAVFCFGMKARQTVHDLLGVLPFSSDPTATRQVDIGRHYICDHIPLFDLDDWATLHNGKVC